MHASDATKPLILRGVERPVKERLVGAAVLMAAAIILIPEMLSGPDRESPAKQAQTGARGEGGVKTYTIDLSQSPGVAASTQGGTVDNRAPPPEQAPTEAVPPPEQLPTARPQVSPESAVQAPTAPAEEKTPSASQPRREDPPPVVAESPPPRQIAAQPARAEAPPQPKVDTPPPRPVASAPSAPTSSAPAASTARSGWAVQLGSYSSEATAERLMKEWRVKGQDAFVMPVKSGGKTLYRVRIGPTKDRAGAEATLKAVKASIPGAAVVAHP